MNRRWTLGIVSVGAMFVIAACGGAAPSTSPPPPAPAPAPTSAAQPTATPEPTPEPAQEAAPARYRWEVSTVAQTGAKASIAVEPQGTPHIAFMLEAEPGFVKHAELGAGGWDIATVATGYFYGPLDIAVDGQGAPRISWHNHDTEDQAFATRVNGEWAVQDIPHPGHDGWDINLTIDSKGRPHTASIDPSQFGSQSGLEYAVYDGQAWTVESVGSGPLPYEFGADIALDSRDRPHVVWFDDAGKDLKYAVRDGGAWTISTVDSEGDVGRFPSLVLDSQGNPVISYYERNSATAGYIKLARWDGSAWHMQRIDKLDRLFLGFLGARKISSLVLDEEDTPLVAYSDEQVVKLAWWDGSAWNLETVFTAADLPLGQQVSLARDGAGVLHLTFTDATRKSSPGVKGVIKYARGTSG